MAIGQQQAPDRFRSFAERYVIERAGQFRAGHELEDAWLAVQDARKIYCMAADLSISVQVAERERDMRMLNALEGAKSSPPMASGGGGGSSTMRLPPLTSPPSTFMGMTVSPGDALANEAKHCLTMIQDHIISGQTPPKGLIQRFYDLITKEKNDVSKKAPLP